MRRSRRCWSGRSRTRSRSGPPPVRRAGTLRISRPPLPRQAVAAEATRSKTSTELPPGHVRKRPTGAIGKVEAVDSRAGTARVRWLKRGAASTVRLSEISRR